MTKHSTKNRKLAPILVSSLIAFAILWVLTGQLRFFGLISEDTRVLNSGWTVTINNEKYVNVSLDDFSFSNLKRLDIIDMVHPLGEEMDGGLTLEILVYLCSVEAYVDEELVYSYGIDEVWDNKMVGSGYHFIPLPDEAKGKNLLIRMVMNEDNAFTSIAPLMYTDSDRAMVVFSRRNIVSLFVDIFLSMLGASFIIIGGATTFWDRRALRMALIGALSFTVGIWSMCTNGLFTLFDINRTLVTTTEYISLYLAPAFIGMIFWDMRKEDKSWRNTVVAMGTTFLVDFAVIACILHFTNAYRLPNTLIAFHIIAAIGIIVMLVSGILSVKNKNYSETIAEVALIIMFVAVSADLVRFNLQKYVLPSSRLLQNSFISIGTLVAVILLLASYFAHLYDMIITNAERDALTKLAYHDALTGLYNRAMSYEVFGKIEQNKEKAAVISFDMNGLKTVNDTFGHDEGDKYLKRMAHLLNRTFEDVGTCYRMGGDEFLVVVPEENTKNVDVCLKKFDENSKKASDNCRYPIEAAYGVAYFNEDGENSVQSTLALADKRMYEKKSTCENSRMAHAARLILKDLIEQENNENRAE